MAYPNIPIQNNYDRYHSKGLVGQIAKVDNNTWFFDVANAGVDLIPGDAVYIDVSGGATTGDWLKPTAGNEDLATHIVSFDQTDLNVDLNIPVGNATSSIIYPAGFIGVKAMVAGSIFVTAGTTILRDQALQFDATVDKYIVNVITPKLLIVALSDANLDQTFGVRINRIA